MKKNQFEVVSVMIEELQFEISAVVLHEYTLPYITEEQMYLRHHLILYAQNRIFHGLRAHGTSADGTEHFWVVGDDVLVDYVNIPEFDDALLVFDHKDTPMLDEVN